MESRDRLSEVPSIWARGRLGKRDGQAQIIFAQVREDAAIELEVVNTLPPGQAMFCIASGGCTALSLLTARPSAVYCVDINPAQVHLVELKKAALATLPRTELLDCLLRDGRATYPALAPLLSQEANDFWQRHQSLLARGVNRCGLIEKRLRQIMRLLPLVQSRRSVHQLFGAQTLEQQMEIYGSFRKNWRWALAFRLLLCKPVLRLAYGREFLAAVPRDFPGMVSRRFDRTVLDFPLRENGYLWQLFSDGYPDAETAWPPYLQTANAAVVQEFLARLFLEVADAAHWLERCEPGSIGFFALSNILEITSPEYAKRLLAAVARAAAPGAKVCLRAIFPFQDEIFADVPALRLESSEALERRDRSFFCTNLRVLTVATT